MSAMKLIYLLFGMAIVILGVVHMLATFYVQPKSPIWFFGSGISMVLAGALNLLNRTYGHTAPGLRRVCVASNLVILVFAAVAGVKSGSGWGELIIILGMLSGATALSLAAVKGKRSPPFGSGREIPSDQ